MMQKKTKNQTGEIIFGVIGIFDKKNVWCAWKMNIIVHRVGELLKNEP
jgi:hypothetical protein